MNLSAAGRGNEGSGNGGGGYVRPPYPEYHCPLYFHSTNTGAMSGGGDMVRGAGGDEMVGAVRPQPRPDKYRDGVIGRRG